MPSILELLSRRENQTLLVQGDALFVLDLGLFVVDAVVGLQVGVAICLDEGPLDRLLLLLPYTPHSG